MSMIFIHVNLTGVILGPHKKLVNRHESGYQRTKEDALSGHGKLIMNELQISIDKHLSTNNSFWGCVDVWYFFT